jgi:hypothetical protein
MAAVPPLPSDRGVKSPPPDHQQQQQQQQQQQKQQEQQQQLQEQQRRNHVPLDLRRMMYNTEKKLAALEIDMATPRKAAAGALPKPSPSVSRFGPVTVLEVSGGGEAGSDGASDDLDGHAPPTLPLPNSWAATGNDTSAAAAAAAASAGHRERAARTLHPFHVAAKTGALLWVAPPRRLKAPKRLTPGSSVPSSVAKVAKPGSSERIAADAQLERIETVLRSLNRQGVGLHDPDEQPDGGGGGRGEFRVTVDGEVVPGARSPRPRGPEVAPQSHLEGRRSGLGGLEEDGAEGAGYDDDDDEDEDDEDDEDDEEDEEEEEEAGGEKKKKKEEEAATQRRREEQRRRQQEAEAEDDPELKAMLERAKATSAAMAAAGVTGESEKEKKAKAEKEERELAEAEAAAAAAAQEARRAAVTAAEEARAEKIRVKEAARTAAITAREARVAAAGETSLAAVRASAAEVSGAARVDLGPNLVGPVGRAHYQAAAGLYSCRI